MITIAEKSMQNTVSPTMYKMSLTITIYAMLIIIITICIKLHNLAKFRQQDQQK